MGADIQFAARGWLSILFISFMILLAGCGAKEPDAIQLRTDLERILEENIGNTSVGNAEIYRMTPSVQRLPKMHAMVKGRAAGMIIRRQLYTPR